jgi:ubiquinone/menaquinone biosynthesis C-methylase UbiE/uncharacterized protein YbaR (Trm112 family)
MKRSTAELLCCPHCRASLSPRDEHADEHIEEGSLSCPNCERSFIIDEGIARFIDPRDLAGPNRRFARFYDWFSRFYDLFTKMSLLSFGGDRKARKVILDRLELDGGRLLEVSIGSGSNLPYLYESPDIGEVYGLDISPGQLARCRSLSAARGWPVELFLATAEALPFKDESFDSILHIGGINFFSNKKGAIEEMIRVARPGCKIVIADESEEIARMLSRIPGLVRSLHGVSPDMSVSVLDLVPGAMEDIRMDGIWKQHFRYHGYCLEFRKPEGG